MFPLISFDCSLTLAGLILFQYKSAAFMFPVAGLILFQYKSVTFRFQNKTCALSSVTVLVPGLATFCYGILRLTILNILNEFTRCASSRI
jgi:uncharacterized membrane protein YjjP (DUF1212 family)